MCPGKVWQGEERVEERGWAYRRRRPEGTVLYEAVTNNLATLLFTGLELLRWLASLAPPPRVNLTRL
ncbi:MAG TPA: hypothetical protein VE057_28190 [Archangium sp.]|nr:hypothetical protein [Archangium sp.]